MERIRTCWLLLKHLLLLLVPRELEEQAQDGFQVALPDLPGLDVLDCDTLGQEEVQAGLDIVLHLVKKKYFWFQIFF